MVLKLKIFLAHNMWKLWFLQRWLFKIILFRDVTSCILIETRQCMEGTCCLHLLQPYSPKMEAADVFETRGLHILEDNIIHIYDLNISTITMRSVHSGKRSFGGPWKWGLLQKYCITSNNGKNEVTLWHLLYNTQCIV